MYSSHSATPTLSPAGAVSLTVSVVVFTVLLVLTTTALLLFVAGVSVLLQPASAIKAQSRAIKIKGVLFDLITFFVSSLKLVELKKIAGKRFTYRLEKDNK